MSRSTQSIKSEGVLLAALRLRLYNATASCCSLLVSHLMVSQDLASAFAECAGFKLPLILS